jgi:hypothetical protein
LIGFAPKLNKSTDWSKATNRLLPEAPGLRIDNETTTTRRIWKMAAEISANSNKILGYIFDLT